MFKQAKSAFIWYHLYKFRRTVAFVIVLLAMIVFSQWVYSDVVEYLTLRDKLYLLDVILPLKWGLIFFNIALSVVLILRLFKHSKPQKQHLFQKASQAKETKEETPVDKEGLTSREASFLHKDLKNQASQLVSK